MEILKKGSRNNATKILQLALNISADGIFGNNTHNALVSFQKNNGLDATGICDSKTWAKIAQVFETIRVGSRGNSVVAWQLFLGIGADGIFGKGTHASTVAFQASADLVADGIVGPKTWACAFGAEQADPFAPAAIKTKPIDFKQYDSRWGSIVFTRNNTYNKKQTIKTSGCGPTSMADIVSMWWDDKATPKELAELVVANGYRTYDNGTAWAFFKFAAEYYGASKFIQTKSIATVKSALTEGAYVVVSFGESKWTTGGHFCVIWDWDGKNFHINDPASSKASRAIGTEEEVRNAAKQYFIFYK